jgi:hypothetical protein
VVMTIHKLTAGDGYTYLTRQVAGADVPRESPGKKASQRRSITPRGGTRRAGGSAAARPCLA